MFPAFHASKNLRTISTFWLRNKRSPRLQRWFERNALTEAFELTHETLG